jgi:hypothetical protein
MTGLRSVIGLASVLSLACGASAPTRLKLSKEPFQNTGLHLVERPGRGELLVAPDLERVATQLRETDGALLRCHVTVDPKRDSPSLAAAKQKLEQDLCAEVEEYVTTRPRPQVGPGSETPARIVKTPGPGIMLVEAWLINAGGSAQRLEPTAKSMFSVRLKESVGGRDVMRYYEELGSLARGSLDGVVEASMGRLYAFYEDVLESASTADVAAPPR